MAKLFLLLRKQCTIYSNFSLKEKQKTAPTHPAREVPKSPKMTKEIASPRQIRDSTKFSALSSAKKNNVFSSSARDLKAARKPLETKKGGRSSAFRKAEEEKIKHSGSRKIEDIMPLEESEGIALAQALKGNKHTPWLEPESEANKDLLLSPSMNPEAVRVPHPREESKEEGKIVKEGSVLLCSCGEPIVDDKTTKCPKCLLAGQTVNECFGYLYEKSEGDKNMLNRYWFALVGKELYRKLNIFIL